MFERFERIRDIAIAMREALARGDWPEVGRQIAEEWENRKRLAPGVSTTGIERLISTARGAGAQAYPNTTRLLITADAGGSNSYRSRVFKAELAALAAETGLVITVCHFPPGTSKWNKIEHRLFSHITHNWRGRPLTSHEVVVNTIAATTTRTGLRVHAELDTTRYPTGVKIPDQQMTDLETQRRAHPA